MEYNAVARKAQHLIVSFQNFFTQTKSNIEMLVTLSLHTVFCNVEHLFRNIGIL